MPARMLCPWFVVLALALPVGAQYGGGLGTAESPHLISTAGHLDALGARPEDWAKHFKLMADLDLQKYGPTEFHMIGTVEEGPFTGVFLGNHKTISNFRRSDEEGGYSGLFGLVEGDGARIENLTLAYPDIACCYGRYIGALVGDLEVGTIANCHVHSGAVQGVAYVGGLVGRNDGGAISDCTVSARVEGTSRVGGLVGQSYFGVIERCRAEVEVLAPLSSYWVGGLVGDCRLATVSDCRVCGTVSGDACVGGLVGESLTGVIERSSMAGAVCGTTKVGGILGLNSGSSVTDCYATAQVKAATCAGGLVGCNGPSCHCAVYEAGVVSSSYACGPVAGASSGGLVGVDDRGEVFDSFWDAEASGCKTSAGGDGKTAKEMAVASTYLAAGWDFVGEEVNGTRETWYIPAAGGYPRLAWELAAGDFSGDARVDFHDYSRLAAQWRQADTDAWSDGDYVVPDGTVDYDDLARFAEVWLAGR
ncbi:MAG: hypothetical protein KBE65_15165 [Phycisphaerae bacterium]|nr:hypothetical protein [Phycisphaerae bacterium]